ncbi:MAG: hypothetical protein ABFS37_07400 [Acidobacteriota bacterium]
MKRPTATKKVLLLTVLALAAVATLAHADNRVYDPAAGIWVAPGSQATLRAKPTETPKAPKGTLPQAEVTDAFQFPGNLLFTRDLTWDGNNFWVAEIWNTALIKLTLVPDPIDPMAGTMQEAGGWYAYGMNPFGLAWDGTNIIEAYFEYSGNPNDLLDDEVVFHNAVTGAISNRYLTPDSPDSDPAGATYDPNTGSLWLSEVMTDTIYELNPADGSVRSSFAAPSTEIRGLAFIDNTLWGVDFANSQLVQMSLTGEILTQLDISHLSTWGSHPDGLASDGEALWLGINTPSPDPNDPHPLYLLRIAIPAGEIFADGFEDGTTDAWSSSTN